MKIFVTTRASNCSLWLTTWRVQAEQGCTVFGTDELQTSGPKADKAKAKFPWARGALVVKVTGLRTHLP